MYILEVKDGCYVRTSLEQLSLMMMRIKKMVLRNERGDDKVTSQCPDM